MGSAGHRRAPEADRLASQLAGIANASVVAIANPGRANELRSDPLTLTTGQTFAPAFFTFNGKSIAATTGDGLKLLADPVVVAGGVPAKSGDIVVLYATGLGGTNPAAAPGDVAPATATLATTLTVTVGGVTVPARDVLYAGLSPQSICGLIQINVKLPADLPNGDVPVALAIGCAERGKERRFQSRTDHGRIARRIAKQNGYLPCHLCAKLHADQEHEQMKGWQEGL